MAFPTVSGFNGSNSGANVTTTSVDVAALVGTPAAGDLIIILITKDGTGTFTWPASPAFTSLAVGTSFTAGLIEARYRVWVGGDSTTVSITHASEGTAWQVYRIAKGTWHGVTAPAAGTVAVDGAGSANPNPPTLNPANWDVEDTLWIAFASNDGNVAITAAPANYTNFQNDRWANSNGGGIASARRNLAAASDDPGTFTMASEQWAAETIAIRPSLAVAGATISAGNTRFAPTVKQNVIAGTIAATTTLFALTVAVSAQNVTGGTISSGNTRFAPTVKQNVVSATIASGNTLFSPTVAYTVVGPTRASTSTLFSPTVTFPAQVVTSGTISTGSTIYVPSTAYSVVGPTRASTAALFSPAVAFPAQAVAGGTIASGNAEFAPSLIYTVVSATITGASQLFSPSLPLSVDLATIPSGLVLSVPRIFRESPASGGTLTAAVYSRELISVAQGRGTETSAQERSLTAAVYSRTTEGKDIKMATLRKDPDELLDFDVDWSAVRAADADSIASIEWVVPSGITQTDENLSGAVATIWLSGGTAGATYTIYCRATTIGGRIHERALKIVVKNSG